jgi:hypothetical protein
LLKSPGNKIPYQEPGRQLTSIRFNAGRQSERFPNPRPSTAYADALVERKANAIHFTSTLL